MSQLDFFNTNQTADPELTQRRGNAMSQQQAIMDLYERHRALSPSQVSAYHPYWPITSIRRAITNLTNDGLLVKTKQTRKGMYGQNEHIWEVVTPKIGY